jgi:hypothetical protein
MLIDQLHTLLERGWRGVFAHSRTHHRAIEHAVALPCVFGRRTISRTLCALGRSDRDWSSDYRVFSRSNWESAGLFEPVIDEYLGRYRKGPISVAIDDTKLRKTGKKIPGVSCHRDPLSPPFHVNLMYGLRFLTGSILFPHYREGDFPPRGFPVRFEEAPPLKRPGKRASEETKADYRRRQKEVNLSTYAVEMIRGLRRSIDKRHGADRLLIIVGDGSFCNRTIFKAEFDRTSLIARCRKDARLCMPSTAGGRRKYDDYIFTPEQVRQRDTEWRRGQVYLGGKRRFVRFKEVTDVLWKRGAGGERKLRLIVIAPVPYKLSRNSSVNYRDPAYFLTTDSQTDTQLLVQTCFDRWQIEVNHRDQKDILGVGQAQVRAAKSVPRHPALAVASYSMLLLAALREFGPGRTDSFVIHPKWRTNSKRASFLDIVTLLRRETNEASVSGLLPKDFAKNLALYADT